MEAGTKNSRCREWEKKIRQKRRRFGNSWTKTHTTLRKFSDNTSFPSGWKLRILSSSPSLLILHYHRNYPQNHFKSLFSSLIWATQKIWAASLTSQIAKIPRSVQHLLAGKNTENWPWILGESQSSKIEC